MKEIVDELMCRRREEVEGDALFEPWEIRMTLYMEDDTLKVEQI